MQRLSEIKSLLAERGLRPRKRFGQNFLHDHNLLLRLVDDAGIGADDVVLEIGPGTGTLTEALLERGACVVACELDDDLADIIQDRIGNRIDLIRGDCLGKGRSLSSDIVDAIGGRNFKLVLVFKWILSLGGVAEMEKINNRKAATIYEAIDSSDGFFTGHADVATRSTMNIAFTSPSPEVDVAVIAAAADAGMVNLKGHRSVGGIRASVYNAFPEEGCNTLASFMRSFAADNRS